MDIISVSDLTVVEHVPAQPSKPPVLFVHGYMAGAWAFEAMQRFFAERGHPTYAVNLRGHHGSRPVPNLGSVSVMDYVRDALEVARWITERWKSKPIVLGHSMGGLVTQKLAELDAALAVVLLCAAPPKGISIQSPALMLRQIRFLPLVLLSKPIPPRFEDLSAIAFNRVPEQDRRAIFDRHVADSGRAGREMSFGTIAVDQSKVRCPLLCISCSDDRFIVRRIGRRIAEKYHAPYWVLPGHGHFFLAEPGWQEGASAISAWLEHAIGRLADAESVTLFASLRERIGDEVELSFYDGLVLRAEIVNVDLAEHEDVILEVLDVASPGPRHRAEIRPGMTISVPLSELVGFSRVSEVSRAASA